MSNDLLTKYDVPVPRYTSYPAVPCWEPESLSLADWEINVRNAFASQGKQGISLYIHLPYCEKLCTYCGCNKKVTRNHAVEQPYVHSIIKEWKIYRSLTNERPLLKELHLGGGTPTFFSAHNLAELVQPILEDCEISPEAEFSVEIHPVGTNHNQLKTLAELGFKRISIGVQDFDPDVQYLINRIQSFEITKEVMELSYASGFTEINLDLIYGLPGQTVETIAKTARLVIQLHPARISFYAYAHVPWKSPGQRLYSDSEIPAGEEKRRLYETARAILEAGGYRDIGMDHFALPKDSLFKAREAGTLHRNFMGYTPLTTQLLIGLGASAISDTGTAYFQNTKEIKEWKTSVNAGQLSKCTGHKLTPLDQEIRERIVGIMCNGKTILPEASKELDSVLFLLSDLIEDGLVCVDENQIVVTEAGRPFLRNIAACFDPRLIDRVNTIPRFSRAI